MTDVWLAEMPPSLFVRIVCTIGLLCRKAFVDHVLGRTRSLTSTDTAKNMNVTRLIYSLIV